MFVLTVAYFVQWQCLHVFACCAEDVSGPNPPPFVKLDRDSAAPLGKRAAMNSICLNNPLSHRFLSHRNFQQSPHDAGLADSQPSLTMLLARIEKEATVWLCDTRQ